MKRFILISLLSSLFVGPLCAQHAPPSLDYLSKVFKETEKVEAVYKREFTKVNDHLYRASVFTMKGELRMEGEYILKGDQLVKHGKFTYYYAGGGVESEGYYELNVKVGSWKRFTLSGDSRPDRYYSPESAVFLRDVMKG